LVTPGLSRNSKKSLGITSAEDEREGPSPISRRRARPFSLPTGNSHPSLTSLIPLFVYRGPSHCLVHFTRRCLPPDGSRGAPKNFIEFCAASRTPGPLVSSPSPPGGGVSQNPKPANCPVTRVASAP